jgi:preprotein translocase subunit SecF
MSAKRPTKRARSAGPRPNPQRKGSTRRKPASPRDAGPEDVASGTGLAEDVGGPSADDATADGAVTGAAAADGTVDGSVADTPDQGTSDEGTAEPAGVGASNGSAAPALAKSHRSLPGRLYHGETNVDFVGRRKLWFTISAVAVVLSLAGLFWKGLNLGIDFEGGTVWVVPAGDASVGDVRDAVDEFGLAGSTIQTLESDDGTSIRIEAEPTAAATSDDVSSALAEAAGSSFDDVEITSVGPSWGDEISAKALRALVVFLVAVTIYIALRFELKMAISTLVALIHDVIITVGVYAWAGLEVTPATVVAVLTILGYSIYDGIVVFDKVDENSRLVSSTGGMSYAGMVNVSLNQALMRSLNTTITALLPVGSLLIVGSWMMGAATLEEFAVALLIGLFSGAYSSLFIASPLLAVLKEREPRFREIRNRVADRGGDRAVVAATIAAGGGRVRMPYRPASAGRGKGGGKAGDDQPTSVVAPSGRVIPARPRKKPRR